jgi:hypothetical protein
LRGLWVRIVLYADDGDILAHTLRKVSVDEAVEDFLAQTLRKMREEEEVDFLAPTLS